MTEGLMKIRYVPKIEGSSVVHFVARAWCALMKEGQWDNNSVLVSPDLQCVFALSGRSIVGCLTFHVSDGQSVVNIAYVHPKFRGQGVYRLMHEEFVEVCRGQGVTHVLNICYPENLGIRETCKKLGYKPYVIHLKLDIKNLPSTKEPQPEASSEDVTT